MKFLKGTYGFDVLSVFLLLVSMLLNLNKYTNILGLFLTIIVIYRAFSKDTYRRSKELIQFTKLVNNVLGRFGKKLPPLPPAVSLFNFTLLFKQLNYYLQEKKNFKIVKCPSCKQKLRVPRGKGSIVITCKKCFTKFDSKS